MRLGCCGVVFCSFIYHACHCGSLIKQLVCGSTRGMDFKMSAMKLPELSSAGITCINSPLASAFTAFKRNPFFLFLMLRNPTCDRVKQADFDAKALQPSCLLRVPEASQTHLYGK